MNYNYINQFGRNCTIRRGQILFYTCSQKQMNYSKITQPPQQKINAFVSLILLRVNLTLGSKFNTILLNYYPNGSSCINFHKDKELNWNNQTGFASLSFGCSRKFKLKNEKLCLELKHDNGVLFWFKNEINANFMHACPCESRVKFGRVSLTFREII